MKTLKKISTESISAITPNQPMTKTKNINCIANMGRLSQTTNMNTETMRKRGRQTKITKKGSSLGRAKFRV